MRARVPILPSIMGLSLGLLVLSVAPPGVARAAAPETEKGATVIDGSGIDNPADDPPELGAEGQPGDAAAASSVRIPCLEDLSPEGDPRKGVQKRPFLKHNRVEVSALGGLYASDVMSSSYMLGGAVAYFPAEDFGFEVLVTRSPVEFRLQDPIAGFDQINRFPGGQALAAFASLVYAPFHAKFKFTEETIVTGDILLFGGAGRTFHDTVQGLTWEAGVGLKLYLWKFVAFRLDIRDFVQPQEILGQAHVTNNIAVLGGFSLWVP